MSFYLKIIKRTESILLKNMSVHYSQPKGFVGRNICYAVYYNNIRYGSIVAGSATRFLPGRNEFFNSSLDDLNNIVNNIFFHVEKQNGKYPCRYFTSKCLSIFRQAVICHWPKKYKDQVIGFESLVELPRTGECYIKDGWTLVGQTKGFTCKRVGGNGTDSWSGKRVWNTNESQLRPKKVFVRKP
jgi:hypothetical protein